MAGWQRQPGSTSWLRLHTSRRELWSQGNVGNAAQLFSKDLLPQLLGDILLCELLEQVRAVLSEGGRAEPLTTMYQQARDHMRRYWPVASFAYGGNPCLATWEQGLQGQAAETWCAGRRCGFKSAENRPVACDVESRDWTRIRFPSPRQRLSALYPRDREEKSF